MSFIVEVENISKKYGNITVVDNVSFKIKEPKILLLDEPLASLDKKLRIPMRTELKEIQKRTGTTFLYVTHDQIYKSFIENSPIFFYWNYSDGVLLVK